MSGEFKASDRVVNNVVQLENSIDHADFYDGIGRKWTEGRVNLYVDQPFIIKVDNCSDGRTSSSNLLNIYSRYFALSTA